MTVKADYFLTEIDEAGGDPKALSHVMKKILCRDEVTKLPLYSSQESLANWFADFFRDKVQKIRDGLPIIAAPQVNIPSCDS